MIDAKGRELNETDVVLVPATIQGFDDQGNAVLAFMCGDMKGMRFFAPCDGILRHNFEDTNELKVARGAAHMVGVAQAGSQEEG